MSPKQPTTKTAWQTFNEGLAKSRQDRPRAAAGSGFETATVAPHRIVKYAKYRRVRPVGHSVFSTLAMGFELTENDRMGYEVIQEFHDWHAISEVEKAADARRTVEEAEEAEAERVAAMKADAEEKKKQERKAERVKRKAQRRAQALKAHHGIAGDEEEEDEAAVATPRKLKLKKKRREIVVDEDDEEEAALVSHKYGAFSDVDNGDDRIRVPCRGIEK